MNKAFVLLLLFLLTLGLASSQPASAATDSWTGGTDANWSSPGNWTGGNAPPQAGDSLNFGSGAFTTLNNDLTAGMLFDGLTFSGGGPFTLNGNSVLLSGQANGNNIGIDNISAMPQTNGMNLSLDWGYYTFSGPGGASLALNGTLTPNLGGVAYFDANVSSSSLTLDGVTGLINGLESAGLTFGGIGSTPTGLATISGGNIVAYSGYTPIASGAIGNGNNLNLTASGAATAYTANNNAVNTLTVAQVGNSGGTATTTVTTTGTLTFGNSGGVYLLGNTLGSKGCLNFAGGSITAGATGPGTIVFAINGNNANNQASVNSGIRDNAGGGSVTVVTTGPGSINFGTSPTNNYSGGTYVTQGQLQFGQPTGLGTGPVFISANASVYFTGTGVVSNNFYLSPGNGSATAAAVANGGALAFAGSGQETLTGTISLLGSPVTQGTAGNRISGNLSASQNAVFTGQITGTGTLDFYVNPHAASFTLQNSTNSPNNWQGGLILEEVLAAPSSARNVIVKLGADNQIPSGAAAGDVTLFSADSSGKNSIVRLDLNGHTNTINGLNGPSALFPVQVDNFSTNNSMLTFGANNASGTFNGVTADNGVGTNLTLVKIGTGTEAFGNALGHHGNTTISNGTFALTAGGTMANSPVITVKAPGTLDAGGIGGFTVGAAQTLNCVGTVLGSTVVNGSVMALDAIGAFTNVGDVTFNGGGSYVWDINDAMGTAGADPGWSLLQITGGLQINSSSGTPFNIKITSLTTGDVPGNAANFNPNVNGSWVLATTTTGISGFTGSGQFNIVTSAFSNAPASSAQWSVGVVGNNLVLFYTSTPVITTPLVSITNNAGSTATYTVVANGAATPLTFNWLQGATLLSNGGLSASGGAVTISSVGHTSTLSIANVQDADAGGFTVNVSNNLGAAGSSSATLTVIDAPGPVTVISSATQSTTPPYVNAAAGGIISLTATPASGTPPLTYVWSLNGIAIATNTDGVLNVNVSQANAGTYTVVASNVAGSATNDTTVIAPTTQVPNQIVYEPFNYTVQAAGAAPWTAFGATNLYNQATGIGLSWLNSGTAVQPATLAQDMRLEPGFENTTFSPQGDSYPWPGLAGDSPQEVYCNVNSFMRLPLGTGGSISSGTVYFSCIVHVDQGAAIATVGTDYLLGFGNGTGTTPNTAVYIQTPGDDSYIPGIFKTSAGSGALSAGVNGGWSAKAYHRGQIVFLIARLTINPGATNDSFDLWLAPTNSTFGASEANLPTPDVTGVGSGAPDVGSVDYFFIRSSAQPFSRRFTDLRIGTTWASVTPPSAPTLSLANVVLPPSAANAVFASQNAGNPVATYQWQFDGGAPLSDGPTGHGSIIAGASTASLNIIGATFADAGTYTVTGSNTDPSNDAVIANGGTLTGSASATLTFLPPPLSVSYSAPNFRISWPTNWTGYTLEQTAALNPAAWTTNSNPPYPVVGTNYSISVNAASGTEFFRLIR